MFYEIGRVASAHAMAVEITDWISSGASVVGVLVTAVGFAFAGRQLQIAQQTNKASETIARTNLEESLAKEYRDILKDLPTLALLGKPVELSDPALTAFFRYFDLCNYQLFLAKAKSQRVSPETCREWAEGMVSNLRREAFKQAWELLGGGIGSDEFQELRALHAKAVVEEPLKPANAIARDLYPLPIASTRGLVKTG